jgi:hypothetical protein
MLKMTDWDMSVETTTKGGRKIACTSEGSFPDPDLGSPAVLQQMIDVVQTQ